MKTLTCKQLGGACDKEFSASTFEEIAELSKMHGTAMFQQGDEAHIEAMHGMRELISDPEAMKKWMEDKRRLFETVPDVK
jgi:hypothetical protein